MRTFLALALLAGIAPARAAPPTSQDPGSIPLLAGEGRSDDARSPVPAAPPRPALSPAGRGGVAQAPDDRPPILGLLLDGGFPDGLALSALYRPVRLVRLDAGLTYNLVGFGLRGGATLVPFRSGVAPILRGEVGHTFDGDASGVVGHFTTLTPTEQSLLRNVGYNYASLQLGLEIGASDRMVFFLRGGLAWYWTTVQDFRSAAPTSTSTGTVIETHDVGIHGTVPTASLGFLLYVW